MGDLPRFAIKVLWKKCAWHFREKQQDAFHFKPLRQWSKKDAAFSLVFYLLLDMRVPACEKQGLLLKDRPIPSQGDRQQTDMLAHNKDNLLGNPSLTVTAIIVSLYVLTGCAQPLLMTLLRTAGLTDSSCQIYMLFYYFGPSVAIVMLWRRENVVWPNNTTILKTCGIAFWDISAQTLNYTGASLAGPAIFAIIYSSVTIWAALFSQAFLARRMDIYQWMAVIMVFAGLALTATESEELGPGVLHGLVMVLFGSMMHGLFYVMSEAVMTQGEDCLSVEQNCAIQGLTASASFLIWQMIYTLPNADEKLWTPVHDSGTSLSKAISLLLLFSAVSFVHSISFYYVLRHISGGATSAGVFKGLQAVLVFVLTDLFYCRRIGGAEMCFSTMKFVSLVTVLIGVLGYGSATNEKAKLCHDAYKSIDEVAATEIGSV